MVSELWGKDGRINGGDNMRIMIPKVKCSECSKKMYINAVPRAYPSGGEMIYICEQCKNESDRNKEVNSNENRRNFTTSRRPESRG